MHFLYESSGMPYSWAALPLASQMTRLHLFSTHWLLYGVRTHDKHISFSNDSHSTILTVFIPTRWASLYSLKVEFILHTAPFLAKEHK